MYRLLEQERQKLEEEKRQHAETKRLLEISQKENLELKSKLAKGVKRSIPSHIRSVVRTCYQDIKKRDHTELDLNVSIDHPTNKSIFDRVVRGACCTKYKPTEADAMQAARDMFVNLRDDNSRLVNGRKPGHLKSVRRRNRMVHKQNTRKAAYESEHCKLSAEKKRAWLALCSVRTWNISARRKIKILHRSQRMEKGHCEM